MKTWNEIATPDLETALVEVESAYKQLLFVSESIDALIQTGQLASPESAGNLVEVLNNVDSWLESARKSNSSAYSGLIEYSRSPQHSEGGAQ